MNASRGPGDSCTKQLSAQAQVPVDAADDGWTADSIADHVENGLLMGVEGRDDN